MASLGVAFVLAFLLTALPGGLAIAWLRQLGAKQNVSEDAPAAHSAKQGTPTMGGLLFLFAFSLIISGLIISQLTRHQESPVLPLFLLTLANGLIGFIDDYLSKRKGKNQGLTASQKFFLQVIAATGFVVYLALHAVPHVTTMVQLIPGAGGLHLDFGYAYYVIAVIFIVGFSNAANFTDGLDGLASGVSILICLALATLTWLAYPDLSLFTIVLAGSLAGFLWWNANPARVFMGDTGSLAIGAALAGTAIVGKQEMGAIIASLICWAELISVMIQVTVFKVRKNRRGLKYAQEHRFFRRTPLHHHFEEMGVSEVSIVQRFWIAGMICAALALLWGRL